jgi:hypothetical protein
MKINHILKEYEYNPEEDGKAYDQYLILRNENPLYAEAFWNMWRRYGNVNIALTKARDEYERITSESVEEDNSVVKEAMSDAYGIVSAEPEVEGSVEFKQHKNTDKGSVSIEAAGDTMQDLADVLKLAGLTLPKDMHNDQEASAHDEEPEQEDVLLSPDHKEKHADPYDKDDDDKCDVCNACIDDCECSDHDHPQDKEVTVISPQDAKYSTDKEVLINFIKDKLKKSIS